MTSSYKKSGVAGGSYYTDCMTGETSRSKTTDDYYSGTGKEPPGTWYVGLKADGTRSSILGLIDGQIFDAENVQNDVKKFSALINGAHPESGEDLVKNVGAENRVALHDFTVSAPKSVSVLWSQADQPTKIAIEMAQHKGARAFQDFMSTKSYVRTGKNGVNKVAAPLMGAMFAHGSSRENDPQLHTHCVNFNVCERPDGKTGALEAKTILKWQGAATSLYHADLAWEVRKLGFGITRKENLFEVAGVPDEVCLAFSQRRQQIVEAVKAKLEQLGLDPDAKLASRGMFQAATIETRNLKNELTREQLISIWRERGAALGFSEKDVTALMSEMPAIELSDDELLKEARLAVEEITENHAIFKEAALVTKIAVQLVGRASSEQILRAVEIVKEKDLLSTFSDRRTTNASMTAEEKVNAEESREIIFTTREMLVLETQMLKLADRKDGQHILQNVDLPSTLDPEQREAALKATQDINAVTVIEGAAGAGKTFTCASIARAYESNGYEVTGLANSWSAALNLKDAAGLENGRAITGWLNGVQLGKIAINEKSLIVLDEAGMIGSKNMKQILELCKDAGAKVILLGDTLQQKSIAAGDPLRCITKQNGTSRLDIIRRQVSLSERKAVNLFFAGKAKEALGVYADKLHCHDTLDATNAAIINSWQSSRLNNPQQTHLILAMDKKSVHELNLLAHDARKAAGELGESILIKTMDCKKDELVELSVKDQVVFRTNDQNQGVFNRVEGTLELIDGDKLYVQTKERLVEIDTTLEKWQHKDGGLALQHAYATTVFASQGLTVDRVFVKDALGLARASAGVAMSRHREHCEIHVDMQVRYEAKMATTPADDWHEFSKFEKEECVARMGTSWSGEREKHSTLDFEDWQSLGARVNAEKETTVQALVDQKNKLIEQKIAALQDPKKLSLADRLRLAVTAEKDLGDHRVGQADDESKKLSIQNFASPQERLNDLIKNTKTPILVNKPLPFQLSDAYKIDAPKPSKLAISTGIERLRDKEIDDDVITEAGKQGFITFDSDGQSVFLGRRPYDGGLVLALHSTQEDQKTEALRHRYPPILHGDPAQVDIVKTGEDAMALWSIQDRKEEIRSTVIVTSGREEALSLPHVQEVMEKSAVVRRYDMSQGKGEMSELNINTAQEQARQAQEQAQKDRELHR